LAAPAVILIPGLLCDGSVWAHQAAALGALTAVQLVEHTEIDSLGAMAESIIAGAPARFAVAGHSMGGRVAFEILRRVPDRVAALALLDTGFRPLARGEAGEREAAGRYRLLEQARIEGMRAMGGQWLSQMVFAPRQHENSLMEPLLQMIERRTPAQFAAQIHALLERPDAGPLLETVRCPTLVLCGRDDAWAPCAQHEEMAARIEGSRLVIVPECGHMSTVERPQAVTDALTEWLEAVR